MREIVLTKDKFLEIAEETIVPDVLKSIWGDNPKNNPGDLEQDINPIDRSSISPAEIKAMSPYYNQTMLHLMVIVGKANSNPEKMVYPNRGHKTQISKQDGKIILRQTYTDPTFMVQKKVIEEALPLQQSIPGTITVDFIFKPGKGFELDKVVYSNEVLYLLAKYPPREPDERTLKKLEQTAARLDAQKLGPRVTTEEKVFELFRNHENSSVLSTLGQGAQPEQKISSIAAHILADKSGNTISLDLDDLTREKLDGGNILRTTIKNPIFTIGKKFYEIPGMITTDYSKEKSGYKFKAMTIRNAALHRFIFNPPTNPTDDDMNEVRKLALAQEPRAIKQDTDITLSPEQLLALTGKKSISQSILGDVRGDEPKGSAAQLEHDKKRGLRILDDVHPDLQAEIERYYLQQMISLPNYILMDKSQEVSLASKPESYKSTIFTDRESGKTMLRVELVDPSFTVSIPGSGNKLDRDDAIQVKIPGKITVDYIFEPKNGFELKEIKFSNKTLSQLITHPPRIADAKSNTAFKDSFSVLQMQATKEEQQKKSTAPIIPSTQSRVMPKGGAK